MILPKNLVLASMVDNQEVLEKNAVAQESHVVLLQKVIMITVLTECQWYQITLKMVSHSLNILQRVGSDIAQLQTVLATKVQVKLQLLSLWVTPTVPSRTTSSTT